MNERFPLLVRRAVYNMRGGFLVRPLTIALSLGCAGALLSWIEEAVPGFSDWVPAVIFPTHADPQVAQVILAGIAASIMTVVSIVFAILLMTLTLASMQFSPRIILSFTRDRVTQWTLGIFLGTFPIAWRRFRRHAPSRAHFRRSPPSWAQCCWRSPAYPGCFFSYTTSRRPSA